MIPPPPWMPLSRNSPRLPWKASSTLGGGGYPFLTATPRGVGTKNLWRLRGGRMRFLRALFRKRNTSHYEKFWTVPYLERSPLFWTQPLAQWCLWRSRGISPPGGLVPASPHLDHYSARSYEGLDPPVHQEMPPALLNHEARYLKIAIKKIILTRGGLAGGAWPPSFAGWFIVATRLPLQKQGIRPPYNSLTNQIMYKMSIYEHIPVSLTIPPFPV